MEKREKFTQGLSAILVRQGVLTEQEAASLQDEFRKNSLDSFDFFLLDEGLVEKEHLLRALGEYFQAPAVDVKGLFFRQLMIHRFPKDIMLRYAFIPMEEDEDVLEVVTSDPDNEELLPIINDYVSYEISLNVGIKRDIEDAVKEFYDKPVTEDTPTDLDNIEGRELEQEEQRETEESEVQAEENVSDSQEVVIEEEDKDFSKKAENV